MSLVRSKQRLADQGEEPAPIPEVARMLVSDQRLLGRLAQLSWFTANGEVAATRSLGFLLESQALRDATLSHLTGLSGVDLSDVQRFVTESVNADGGRPDLQGLDVGGKPLLVVEAKFGAVMTQDQVMGYVVDQQRRLGGSPDSTPGLLVLLVPESRRAEARHKASIATRMHAENISTLVLSWAEWLDTWREAFADGAGSASLRSDVDQLSAMCHTLGGHVIAPLAGAAAGGAGWRTKYEDLAQIVDAVTSKLGSGFPIGDERGIYMRRRYFPAGYVTAEHRSVASVGIQLSFADEGLSPVWLRFHKQTPGFPAVRDLVVQSEFRTGARGDDGHLWLPLTVDPDLPGPDLVEDLVAQVRAIQAIVGVNNPAPQQA